MGDRTGISWTDATWNPIVGCSVISPGCTNCYAMKMAARLERMGQPIYRGVTQQTKAGPVWTGTVEASNWGQVIRPLSWRRPRRIFVNSMSDLFHENLPDDVRDTVFAVMANCPQHTFQVLTKRADVMRRYMADPNRLDAIYAQWHSVSGSPRDTVDWPLPNVWLGVSVEDQRRADERIPDLLATPARVRFLSCEPLLGPVDLCSVDVDRGLRANVLIRYADHPFGSMLTLNARIDWAICGGESGPAARPMNPDWARDLRDQCAAATVPFFFKQWGEWLPGTQYTAAHSARDPGDYSRFVCMDWEDGVADEVDPMDGLSGDEVYRVGTKHAGCTLDGRQHQEFPA